MKREALYVENRIIDREEIASDLPNPACPPTRVGGEPTIPGPAGGLAKSPTHDAVVWSLFRSYRFWLYLLIGFSFFLRLSLAIINSESNDDHMPVVEIIASEWRLPSRDECWECFQPKLYHVVVAFAVEAFPGDNKAVDIRLAQILNAIAGLITVIFAYKFIVLLTESRKLRLLSTALVALNPALAGINAQATNDSFVILFGVIATYYAFFFLKTGYWIAASVSSLSAGMAAASKASGTLILALIISVVVLQLIRGKQKPLTPGQMLPWLTITTITVLTVIPFGQYYENYCTYGSPYVTNMAKEDTPGFFDNGLEGRPGITSIDNSFLRFRLVSMLREPYITYDSNDFPWHRTSFWSQLYGRAHFIHFDPWPPTWVTERAVIWEIGRVILVLALIPTILIGAGLLRGVLTVFRRTTEKSSNDNLDLSSLLPYLILLMFVLASVYYALQYHDTATIKAIFLLPALLGFTCAFINGYQWLTRSSRAHFVPVIDFLLVGLVILYSLDLLLLLHDMPFYGIPPNDNNWPVQPLSKLAEAPFFCGR
jgi:hypothetical protein